MQVAKAPDYNGEPMEMLRNAILKRAVLDFRSSGTEKTEKDRIAKWFEEDCPIGNGITLLDDTGICGKELLRKIKSLGRKSWRARVKNEDRAY